MSVPAVATVALVAVIDEWNNFVWPLIITNSVNMRTLPIGLMYLKSNEGLTNWGVLMSGTLIVVLPMLLVFLFAQRYIVTGRSEEHTSELQSRGHLVCRLLLEKKKD